MVNQPGQIFVGRNREMETLLAGLGDALSRNGQIVMLAGEPGIGKTRLAQELVRHAQEREVQVLWGWCYEGEGAPSYWPWVDSIRTYVQRTEPGLLRKQLGSGAAPIAEMIPEVLAILDDVEPAPTMEP
ncbi:MAG: AAA family ATPase, partial [Dehalococcoidia bacterium]